MLNRKTKQKIKALEEENRSLSILFEKYRMQAIGLEEKLRSYEPASETLKFENLYVRYKGMKNQYDTAEKCWQGYMAALMFNGVEDANKSSFLITKERVDDCIANCRVTVNPDFDTGKYEIIAERVNEDAGEAPSGKAPGAEVS